MPSKRVSILLMLLLLILAYLTLATVAAQDDEPDLRGTSFEAVSELGRALPQRMVYSPQSERYAVVDAYGRLRLADAITHEDLYTLYTEGDYNDLAFSHDGRWLALAIGTRIELWNVETGELAADLVDLSQARRVHGPISFSEDDTLLLFFGTYPAPPELRRYENDTTTVPWLWHLGAAREESESTFANNVEAVPFFDYRNGFVLGPDNRIVAALPGRLHVLDAYSTAVLYEIDTARYEQDPMTTWFSARDKRIYVQPIDGSSLIQVDTQRGVLVEFPLYGELTLNDLQTLGGIELGAQATVIGEAASQQLNPLLTIFLGDNYRDENHWGNRPLTVTLIDLLQPPFSGESRLRALLFLYDEQAKVGFFAFNDFYSVSQMTLSLDGEQIVVRRHVQDEQIQVYDLVSGEQLLAVTPALRGIGRYSPASRNRVLAYDTSGAILVSDFERLDAESGQVLSADLRYSRAFDRYFFTEDGRDIVTLSGSEWRLWDAATGEVLQRKALPFSAGSILATSPDGFRYLTITPTLGGSIIRIYDVASDEQRSLFIQNVVGRDIWDIYPSPDWEYHLIVFSDNSYGPYYPGNEIAIYGMREGGQLWFFAGDDLPSPYGRLYGWISNKIAYIHGEQSTLTLDQPERVFGVEYDPSGVPACLARQFPALMPRWTELWDQATLQMTQDRAARLAQTVCGLINNASAVEQKLLDVATPQPAPTLTPIVIPGVPVCLTAHFPYQADTYASEWVTLTEGMTAEQRTQAEALLCEGLNEQAAIGQANSSYPFTMTIDLNSGERSVGSFTPSVNTRPIQPILDEFYRTERRDLDTAILSPDAQYIAASGLPGELVIYHLKTTYDTLLSWETATAGAELATANLIGALASPTPTYSLIGTARATLTPTITPTSPPMTTTTPEGFVTNQSERICPAEELYSIAQPPPGYSPVGRIIGPVQGDVLWSIEPEDGRRNPDPSIPPCGIGLNCNVSPDRQWILAHSDHAIYLTRPDGSESRILFDDDPPAERYEWPREIWWAGANTLEWEVYLPIPDDPYGRYAWQIHRDIFGVSPDPEPIYLDELKIHGRSVEILGRQPGGDWLVARTRFSTGIGPGYQYYLYNFVTGETQYIARQADSPDPALTTLWHPLGDRLFYGFVGGNGVVSTWYQFTPSTDEHVRLGSMSGGTWSNDGRYRVYSTDNRAYPVGVWDSDTGLVREYCLPETGARLYDGDYYWSPDSRYIALQTGLPADENVEGVGQHVLVLDLETGAVVDLTHGGGDLFLWANDTASGGAS